MPIPQRPNVLFILTDDQQFDAISALGNDQIHTPQIDRLVHEGVSFSRAYIMGGNQPAVCCPSRAMIHTGRSLYRTGCTPDGSIPAGVETMAETFRKAGYRTFATGKQHNGPGAVARGFTDAGKLLFAGMGHHMHLTVHEFDPTGQYAPEHGEIVPRYSIEMFTDAALSFLAKDRGSNPFFMYLAYTVPHDPIMAPAEYMSLYDPDAIRLHPTFQASHPIDVSRDGDRVRPMQSCDECEADAVVKYYKWPIEAGIMFAWQNGRGFAGPTGRNPSAQANGLGVRAFPSGGLKGRDSRWRREAGAYVAPSGLTLLRIPYPARWAGLRNCRAVGALVPQPTP